MSKLAFSSALTVLLLCGCQPMAPPAGDRHLIDRFAAVAGAGEDLPVPERVRVAGSERLALVTRDGVLWQAPAGELAGGVLAFSIAVPGDGGGTAIIERTTGDGSADEDREELLRIDAAPGAWIRRRLPFDRRDAAGNGEDRLVLRSEGTAVAWAEIHWLPAAAGARTRPVVPPDVVLISIDTLRSDHLSAYGYRRPTSPNLDRLADESLLFTRSSSASTWTLPSTATLLTGLLPAQHGLRKLGHRLAPSVETLAERLQRHGYRTAAITDGGFVGPDWGFSQGFERYDATAGEAWAPKDVAIIAAAASRWIEENRFHPFFLFVHTYETHKPYTNREGFADAFLDPAYAGRFRDAGRFEPFDKALIEGADRDRIVDFYDGEIRRADHYLGRFLDRLRSGGRWQETAVVVTSDHGEEFLEHGDFDHGFGKVFDENVGVPLLVKLPGDRTAGARIELPVSGLDVAPTVLTLAGASTEGLLGRSVATATANESDASAVVIHGTNSFPKLREERFRLDLGSITVIFDKVRGEARWYDRQQDPDLHRPQGEVFSGASRAAAERLQALLAWSVDGAELMARLPDGGRRLLVPQGSKIEPLGAWSEWSWTPARPPENGEWGIPLGPRGPHVLALSPGRGRSGWRLLIEPGGDPPAELVLEAGPARIAGWNPLRDDLPAIGVLFPGSVLFQPGTAELNADNVEELKALGYL